MENNIHRITEWSLLRFGKVSVTTNFCLQQLDADTKQFVEHEDASKSWDNIVWYNTKNLNKLYYDTEPQIKYVPNSEKQLQSKPVELLIQEGYDFTSIFGILIVISDLDSKNIYVSKIIKESDFQITNNKLLIDGKFWLLKYDLHIPETTSNLCCEIVEIKYNRFNNHKLLDYPTELTPLFNTKPASDNILCKVSFDNGYWLNIEPYTTLNKTMVQAVLDYFETEVSSNITCQYKITYGDKQNGYNSITVKNEDNIFGAIKLGLDLTPYNLAEINVVMEIIVDGKYMRRTSVLSMNVKQLFASYITDNITHPTTNYPVEVTKNYVLNQEVIETKTNREIVTVFQPVFVEIVTNDITIENKNITFPNVNIPSYLVIFDAEEKSNDSTQVIYSKPLADGKVYFDCSELKQITKNSKYQLFDSETNKIIGSGNVLVTK